MENSQRVRFARFVVVILLVGALTVVSSGCKRTTDLEVIESIGDGTTTESIGDEGVAGATLSDLSPLTGMPIVQTEKLNSPIAVMLDNHSAARPQSALNQADIVYEIMAEGLITRYMAVYYDHAPTIIGPVRSARSYFIDKAMELGAIYVHVGGSPQSLKDLKDLSVPQIEGLTSSIMYRDTSKGKKAPHNLYANGDKLLAEIQKKSLVTGDGLSYLKWFDFSESDTYVPIGDTAQDATLTPKRVVDEGLVVNSKKVSLFYKGTTPGKGNYIVAYAYDGVSKRYLRNINEKPCVDEVDGTQVAPVNIIVQFAGSKVMDDVGRLDVSLVGEGDGLLLTGGTVVPIRWSKASRRGLTEYHDSNGAQVVLRPGQTWIQVIGDTKHIGW